MVSPRTTKSVQGLGNVSEGQAAQMVRDPVQSRIFRGNVPRTLPLSQDAANHVQDDRVSERRHPSSPLPHVILVLYRPCCPRTSAQAVRVSCEAGQQRVVVPCNVRDRDPGSFVEEATRRVAAEVRVGEDSRTESKCGEPGADAPGSPVL